RFFGCGGEFAARTERHRLRLRRPFPVARQPVLVDDVAQCLAGRAGPARVATDGRCCGARPGVAGRHHFLWVVAGLARPLPRFQSVARIPCRDAQKEPIMTALIVSNIVLWVVTLALLLVVLALSRQIGVLYERVAPMGALTIDKGPAVGAASPRFELDDLLGRALRIGHGGARSQLLFFVSPTCPVCKKLLPILKSVARTEGAWLDIVLASDGEMPEHLAFYRKAGLEHFPYVLSTEIGMRFQVSK